LPLVSLFSLEECTEYVYVKRFSSLIDFMRNKAVKTGEYRQLWRWLCYSCSEVCWEDCWGKCCFDRTVQEIRAM